ncbi:N-acetylmuramic acid 6-phosphate etherase [Portibacter marinus]|uniref:N-acetylmuramic acid 6-phosphate etherase n=1 Tax=Portibacter marinus TaxID=2898660 RepID=UPI001F33F4BB|nr:N-acetylmuramic acid 6-phosphate etherase [Portibacter marinus]
MDKITEKDSLYRHLDKMSTHQLLESINQEDRKVADAVYAEISSIASLVDHVYPKMNDGGRLFYIGAGTSGRLGILDASECPPTFGVPDDWVVGLIAGGDKAIRKAVENAEDDMDQAIIDLEEYGLSELDTVLGIAASGTTPYVIGGLKDCQKKGIVTGCITCNPGAPVIKHSDHPIIVQVGPEFVTGSTRMKSGTAQKMVLNMISTSIMIKLGRVVDNKMVDMQLSNAKLVDRGTKMIMRKSNLTYKNAKEALLKHGSVREALRALDD